MSRTRTSLTISASRGTPRERLPAFSPSHVSINDQLGGNKKFHTGTNPSMKRKMKFRDSKLDEAVESSRELPSESLRYFQRCVAVGRLPRDGGRRSVRDDRLTRLMFEAKFSLVSPWSGRRASDKLPSFLMMRAGAMMGATSFLRATCAALNRPEEQNTSRIDLVCIVFQGLFRCSGVHSAKRRTASLDFSEFVYSRN